MANVDKKYICLYKTIFLKHFPKIMCIEYLFKMLNSICFVDFIQGEVQY